MSLVFTGPMWQSLLIAYGNLRRTGLVKTRVFGDT